MALNDPLIRVRLEVDQALRTDRDAAGSRPRRGTERGTQAAREYADARRTRDREREPARFAAPADRAAVTQRLAGMIASQSGRTGGAAGRVLGTAARGSRAIGATGVTAGISRIAPAVGVAAGGLEILERVPGIVLAAFEGLTGIPVDSSIADGIAATIRQGRANVNAAYATAQRQFERSKQRLLLGGEVALDEAMREASAFQAVEAAREAWRSKVDASMDQTITRALAEQLSGRNREQEREPGPDEAARVLRGREGLDYAVHRVSLDFRRTISGIFGGG